MRRENEGPPSTLAEPKIEEIIKEIQADVGARLNHAFDSPLEKNWKGSDPFPAFDADGNFLEDNWTDARIGLFREFFASMFAPAAISNQIVTIGDLEIAHEWEDDQNYVFIHNTKTSDLYYVTWYKSRGRTDRILHNGKKITLPEFRKLIEEMLKPPMERVY